MNDTNQHTARTSAFSESLKRTAVSLGQIGDFVCRHPDEVAVAIEGAQSVSENLTELLMAASTVSDSRTTLDQKMTATEQGTDWVAERFAGGCNGCLPDGNFGRVVNSFYEL